MPALSYGLSSFERAEGDLPELPVINMYAEAAPTEESGVVLQSRAGMDYFYTTGAGPVEALLNVDNLIFNTGFAISNTQLYAGGTYLGNVDGPGPFSMAAYENYLFVNGGESLWAYNGVLAPIAFPDGADVAKVLVAASRIVAIRKDTGKFYWSEPLGVTIGALDFATAENQPDRLVDMVFIDDALVLGGRETIEFWANTGDAELPFIPIEGRVFEKGVRATGCMTKWGVTFAWVGDDNAVYINGQEPTRISNEGLEAKTASSATCRLWAFDFGSQDFLALRLDNQTYVFGSVNGLWSEFQTQGGNWTPQCYSNGTFGSSIDGRTMYWGNSHIDLGGYLERRFRAGRPLNSGGVQINNITIRTNPGQTPFLTGDYVEPILEMRTSRDAGQTWGNWRPASLGKQGEYRKVVQYRACGMASQPGFFAEFRLTAPVPFRVSAVLANEPGGGR